MLLRGGEGNPKGSVLSILAHFCGNQSEYVNRSSEIGSQAGKMLSPYQEL